MTNSVVTLLQRAIGDRSIAEFALQCNVKPSKISDCLYNEFTEFTKDELVRMAGSSYGGVTLDDYLNTFDISDSNSNMVLTSQRFIKLSRYFMDAVKFQLDHLNIMSSTAHISTEYELMKRVTDVAKSYNMDYSINAGIELKHTTPDSTVVQLSWAVNRFICKWEFVIVYKEEDCERTIESIDRVEFDNDEVYKYGATVQLLYDKTNPDDPYWIVTELKYPYAVNFKYDMTNFGHPMLTPISSEQRLLNAIFGDDVVVRTIEGFGFKLPKETYLLDNFYRYHLHGKEDQSKQKQYSHSQYCTLIANIIWKETGLRVYHFTDDDTDEEFIIFPSKFPWELSKLEKYLPKTALYAILDRYARELRTTVQKCYCKTSTALVDEFDELDQL